MNQGVHYVDLLRWCMGPVTEVTAVCTTQAHQIEAEDTALAIVRFSSGAVGTILSSTAAFPGFPQRLEITGTEGTVIVEDGQIVRRAFGAGARADGGDREDGGDGRLPGPRTLDPTRRRLTSPATRRRSPTCWPRSTTGASPPSAGRPAATRSRSSARCTSRLAPVGPSSLGS